MNVITHEDKRLAELRSRFDRLWKLEKSLNSIIKNPKIAKKDVEKYISRIEDSKSERKIIIQEINKVYDAIDWKKDHERCIKSGEEDPLYEIEQKVERLEIQKQKFITDLKNMENSWNVFKLRWYSIKLTVYTLQVCLQVLSYDASIYVVYIICRKGICR
jgi:uncharacterized protein (UPF0335 family)